MGTVVTSGSIGGEVVNTLAGNTRAVGLIPPLGTIFLIFITPMTIYSAEKAY